MGVEEEFLLVDPRSRAPVGRGPRVVRAASGLLGARVQPEFFTSQVEVCSQPASSADALRADLARLRSVLGAAAADEGCLLVASGTPPIPPDRPLEVTDGERYRRMEQRFAHAIGRYDQVVCGCHVHVGVTGRAQALALANHMRPWLPVLQALAANSPYAHGVDTGYASWRSVEHARWPTVGPAPLLDEAGYDRLAQTLVRGGTLMDRRMIYWYARPSEHVPTLEIRVADVTADLDTVVLLAILVRGLAAALAPEIDDGRPPPRLASRALLEAHRLGAANGLDGEGLDPVAGLRVPAPQLLDRLLERAAPGLEAAGDLAAASALVERIRTRGNGAARQRSAYARRGRIHDVVDGLARSTAAV
ncbi:carboxylate-amine ligase [Streptomyces sp. NPDC055254]